MFVMSGSYFRIEYSVSYIIDLVKYFGVDLVVPVETSLLGQKIQGLSAPRVATFGIN